MRGGTVIWQRSSSSAEMASPEVFGFFLMVLIGLELLETIKAYVYEDRIHAEVVFLVALVAVSRKVIILDHKEVAVEILFGMSALILALAASYFLVRRALNVRLVDGESSGTG